MDSKYFQYQKALSNFFEALNEATNTGVLGNPLLAIGDTKSQIKTTNAVSYKLNGILKSLAATAAIAFTATTHDIPALKERQYLITVPADGTPVVTAGAVADVDASVLPAVPADSAVLGSLKIALANEAVFDATTTLLDATDVTATFTQGYVRSVDDIVALI